MPSPLINIDNIFNLIFEELKNKFDCNYLSYQYNHQDFKLIFATNIEWTNLYINNSLIENCSLIRVGKEKINSSKTSSVILRWNDISPISKEEKNTAGIRSEFNICNGISFGRKRFGVNEYVGFATDIKHIDFTRKIIFNSTYVNQLIDNLFYASTIKLFYDSIINFKTINSKLLTGINNHLKTQELF